MGPSSSSPLRFSFPVPDFTFVGQLLPSNGGPQSPFFVRSEMRGHRSR
jgi:hypothetical protein